jgi:hypothetical protein
MKYLALIYTAAENNPAYGTPEFAASLAAYQTATQTFVTDGIMRGGEVLHPPTTATTIKVRNGKISTLDGPFAETKEQLGGYYIFECEDLDTAIKYASQIPGAAIGSVEIRPILSLGNNT